MEKEGHTEIERGWNQSDPPPCLENQRQDSFMTTPDTSDTAPRLQKPVNRQKKKRLGKVKTAMSDRRSERSTVPTKSPRNQNGSRKKVPKKSVCLAQKDPEHDMLIIHSDDSPEDVPEPYAMRTRVQKTNSQADVTAAAQKSSLQDSGTATSEATPGAASELKFSRRRKRSIWTVDHIEGTKLTLKKRRLCYQPEDLEAFYRLLEDPVVQKFLAADVSFRVSDKYLLSMVVEYFGRLGLPGHLYNRIHFFLALYIACDMEEDDPVSKWNIFPFLLGEDTWPDLYKDFQRLRGEFLQVIDYRVRLTREECEEIQNQNPHCWAWSRVRQSAPEIPRPGNHQQVLLTPAISSPQQDTRALPYNTSTCRIPHSTPGSPYTFRMKDPGRGWEAGHQHRQ